MRQINRHVIKQVSVDYYQKGIETNMFQRMWHLNKLKNVLGFVPKSPRNILDVGCASGWFISEVAKAFPTSRCFGIDIFDEAVLYGQQYYPRIKFKTADAHRIPYSGNIFDLVICAEVLEHVDDPKQILLEIRRVLRKNGAAIIELDSGSTLFSIAWYLWRKWNGKVWNDAHLHSFNPKKLEKIILSLGFKIEKKKKFNLGMAMIFLLRK